MRGIGIVPKCHKECASNMKAIGGKSWTSNNNNKFSSNKLKTHFQMYFPLYLFV